MRVLLVHNFYRQPGGEDAEFEAEGRLLEAHGHEVVRYALDNADASGARLAAEMLWNPTSYADVLALARRHRPDVVHFHNTFPRVSPAAYYAARAAGVPVVQTLHNYRLVCPNALLFRDGRPCESCVGMAVPWPGVVHGCYRGSPAASAGVAALLMAHRAARSWTRTVDLFVTPTEFARRRCVAGGLPAHKLAVKPNAVDDVPSLGTGRGGYALYVGRLSPEKGVRTLLAAWSGDDDARPPLVVVGDGPLTGEVRAAAAERPDVTWLGQRSREDVAQLLAAALCVVVPSHCYETFGRVVVEAFAAGTPAVVSRIGALEELVEDGVSGTLFTPGDPAAFAAAVRARAAADPCETARWRHAARAEYERHHHIDRNYEMLLDLYHRVARPAAEVSG
ncbi:MAG TPA: glycosyltransferase [Gemmatimonadaceae bacterium]|nr:glycosyltransferase [Gemmatimonadaceae bacterium]